MVTLIKNKETQQVKQHILKCRDWLAKNTKKTPVINKLITSIDLTELAKRVLRLNLSEDEMIIACIEEEYDLKKVSENIYNFNLELLS